MTPEQKLHELKHANIVVFDGVCNFCNGSVNFIIKRDPEEKYMFAPIQSQFGKFVLETNGIDPAHVDTFVLIKGGTTFVRSNAALQITRDLTGYWHLLYIFRIVPVAIRDWVYSVFARHRYKLFGRREVCVVPTEDIRRRFIDLPEPI